MLEGEDAQALEEMFRNKYKMEASDYRELEASERDKMEAISWIK